MKNLIFTTADINYFDFFYNEWYVSLNENNDLKNIDVLVLDYGFSKEQLQILKKTNIKVLKCVNDGFPNSIKFRDIVPFLKKHKYDQVMTTDGGDIIFQGDISALLKENKDSYRAVCEEKSLPFVKLLAGDSFTKDDLEKIKKVLEDTKMINAGVVVAPYKKFISMSNEICSLIKKHTFGPDQIAINYIFYRDGFHELENIYNFMFTTNNLYFRIKKGVFYLSKNKKPLIVHNTGKRDITRIIKQFGYGEGKNTYSKVQLFFTRLFIRFGNIFR